MNLPALRSLAATRYVQPLREGGSLPAVVDTEDGLFVVKFRGAGQGAGALVAELIAGRIAQALGLPVPELALVDVAAEFGRTEPDPEIQELLRRSHGTNVGLRYLDGAFNYDGNAASDLITPELAAAIVWLDALVTNPDRTHRNPNLLVWQRSAWLIDHGTALYVHHDWSSADDVKARTPFKLIQNHVLLAQAGDIAAADEQLHGRLTREVLQAVLEPVPEDLLLDPAFAAGAESAASARARYEQYLWARLQAPRAWVTEAASAQLTAREAPPQRKRARR